MNTVITVFVSAIAATAISVAGVKAAAPSPAAHTSPGSVVDYADE